MSDFNRSQQILTCADAYFVYMDVVIIVQCFASQHVHYTPKFPCSMEPAGPLSCCSPRRSLNALAPSLSSRAASSRLSALSPYGLSDCEAASRPCGASWSAPSRLPPLVDWSMSPALAPVEARSVSVRPVCASVDQELWPAP
jgi:hypothetical protein